jgi:O-antigen/teichoic acid export membrane protein
LGNVNLAFNFTNGKPIIAKKWQLSFDKYTELTMEKYLKSLKIILGIQLLVAMGVAAVGGLFIGIMAGINSEETSIYIAWSMVFAIIFLPVALLTWFAWRELNQYSHAKSLKINIAFSLLISVFWFPFTLFNAYNIKKLYDLEKVPNVQ